MPAVRRRLCRRTPAVHRRCRLLGCGPLGAGWRTRAGSSAQLDATPGCVGAACRDSKNSTMHSVRQRTTSACAGCGRQRAGWLPGGASGCAARAPPLLAGMPGEPCLPVAHPRVHCPHPTPLQPLPGPSPRPACSAIQLLPAAARRGGGAHGAPPRQLCQRLQQHVAGRNTGEEEGVRWLRCALVSCSLPAPVSCVLFLSGPADLVPRPLLPLQGAAAVLWRRHPIRGRRVLRHVGRRAPGAGRSAGRVGPGLA